MKTVEQLHKEYGFDNDLTEKEFFEKRLKDGTVLNPIYEKHLPACWEIENVYDHACAEEMSLGKARELTAAIIEKHIKGLSLSAYIEEDTTPVVAVVSETETVSETKPKREIKECYRIWVLKQEEDVVHTAYTKEVDLFPVDREFIQLLDECDKINPQWVDFPTTMHVETYYVVKKN